MNLSGYRLMWIFVMFDLPVDTKEHAREATNFREFLLDEGFEMSQFSIYARFCNGKEHYETYLRRIEAHLPERGEIHVLNFTDKQYESTEEHTSELQSLMQISYAVFCLKKKKKHNTYY